MSFRRMSVVLVVLIAASVLVVDLTAPAAEAPTIHALTHPLKRGFRNSDPTYSDTMPAARRDCWLARSRADPGGRRDVVELDWWEGQDFRGLRLTCTPAQLQEPPQRLEREARRRGLETEIALLSSGQDSPLVAAAEAARRPALTCARGRRGLL